MVANVFVPNSLVVSVPVWDPKVAKNPFQKNIDEKNSIQLECKNLAAHASRVIG